MLIPIVTEDGEVYFEMDAINKEGALLLVNNQIVKVDKYGLQLYSKYIEGKGRWRAGLRYKFMYRIVYDINVHRKEHGVVFFHRELLGLANTNINVYFRNKNTFDYRLCNYTTLSFCRMYEEGNDNARMALDVVPKQTLFNIQSITKRLMLKNGDVRTPENCVRIKSP